MSDVNLTISKEVVTPIVEAKIKEAILLALGGGDVLIDKVVNNILTQKVAANGTVSNYSSDNKYSWMEIAVTNSINNAARLAIQEVIAKSSEYVARETAVQSHKNQDVGADVHDHIRISPTIVVVGATLVHCASHIADIVL